MINLLFALLVLFGSVSPDWRAFAASPAGMQAMYNASGSLLYVGEGWNVEQEYIAHLNGGVYVRNAPANACASPTNIDLWTANNFGLREYQIYFMRYGRTWRWRLVGVDGLTAEDDTLLTREYERVRRWLERKSRDMKFLDCRSWEIVIQRYARKLGYTWKVEAVR